MKMTELIQRSNATPHVIPGFLVQMFETADEMNLFIRRAERSLGAAASFGARWVKTWDAQTASWGLEVESDDGDEKALEWIRNICDRY